MVNAKTNIANYTSNEFKIRFDGQLEQIDAATFISSLSNISVLVDQINQELESTNKIKVQIKALERGSFIAGISLVEIEEAAKALFSKENIVVAGSIITILVGILELKKQIGTNEPDIKDETDELVTIELESGNQVAFDRKVIDVYRENPIVRDAISNNFSAINGDPSVTEFELLGNEDEVLFEAGKNDFENMAGKSIVSEEDKKIKEEVASVVIRKIVFDPNNKWEFYYQNNKIAASITDEDFFKKIDEGEKFAKGDTLKVRLQITQVLDKSVNVYVNSSYEIVEVLEHNPKTDDEQTSLNIS